MNDHVARKEDGIVLTEDTSKSKNGEDENEAKTGKRDVAIAVRGDGDWVGGDTMVIVGCPS